MIFFPTNNTEVSDFLRSRSNTSLHISGNDKDGNNAEIISLSKLNSVLFYEPEEMIISVQSGIRLQNLQNTLAANGQWIPTLAASESLETTLGAAVAADHFHPRSLNCGALRTTILGGTFCTTSGEIFKSGSRVVKSVAGYDIHRAFCGSQGLFGIILDLTLKVQPLPETSFRFFADLKDRERLLQFHPTCLEEFSGKLLIELSGFKEDVSFDIEQINAENILIQELSDEDWVAKIKDLINFRDTEKDTKGEAEFDALLTKVRNVFDPEKILV